MYPVCVCVRVCVLSHFSCVQLFVTLWTIAHQTPLAMGFSRQEYWSELSFPSLGDIPKPGIKPTSLMSPALAGKFFTTSATWEGPTASGPKSKNDCQNLSLQEFKEIMRAI